MARCVRRIAIPMVTTMSICPNSSELAAPTSTRRWMARRRKVKYLYSNLLSSLSSSGLTLAIVSLPPSYTLSISHSRRKNREALQQRDESISRSANISLRNLDIEIHMKKPKVLFYYFIYLSLAIFNDMFLKGARISSNYLCVFNNKCLETVCVFVLQRNNKCLILFKGAIRFSTKWKVLIKINKQILLVGSNFWVNIMVASSYTVFENLNRKILVFMYNIN